jgi:hypothetical protein
VRTHPRLLAVLAVAVAVIVLMVVTAPAAAGEPVYTPPVDAPIADPFRAPASRYGSGNRGIEYATTPGTAVRAIGAGEVVFAGPVAGALHVTVRHPDGLRSSYSFLATITVSRGDHVLRGDTVGTSADRLHLGVRHGDRYIDPALLFAAAVRVRLVPVPEEGVRAAASEIAALRQLTFGVLHGPGFLERAVRWLGDRGTDALDLVGGLASNAPLPVVARRLVSVAVDLGDALAPLPAPCTPPSVAVTAAVGRRVALLVGGLGSSSSDAAIDSLDTARLGYAAGDVVRFSYAGGLVPDATDRVATGVARPYRPRDTQRDLRASARLLATTISALAATVPDASIDVFAHSQGGVVARLAMRELALRGTVPASVDLVVTLGAPHQGSSLATAVAVVGRSPLGTIALDVLGGATNLDPAAPSPAQLAPGSEAFGDRALADGVRWLSLAARGDLVVPSESTELPGAAHVVVAVDGVLAHARLPGADEVTDEIGLALAGRPPRCEGRVDRVLDVLAGGATALGHDVLLATVDQLVVGD